MKKWILTAIFVLATSLGFGQSQGSRQLSVFVDGYNVYLNWIDSTSTGVTKYYVYRSATSGGSYIQMGVAPAGPATGTPPAKYVDYQVPNKRTWYYVVTAVNSSGQESAYSAQVSAVVP